MVETLDTDGEPAGEVDGDAFTGNHRPDLVKRAYIAAQANAKQPHGSDEFAGLRTSAESWGSGRGAAHVPRIKNGSTAARVPHAVGGRAGHPPKKQEKIGEDLNRKERRKAFQAALAATADEETVRERGHDLDDDVELPLVFDEEFEDLVKTQEVLSVLEEVGVAADVERADEGRKIRAGQGKARGRKYRTPTSILFVVSDEFPAARNLPGCDVVQADSLGVHHLAPGGEAGRLTAYTEPALEVLEQR